MQGTIRTLMIEDNPADAAVLKKALGEIRAVKIDVSHATTLAEGLARAEVEEFDVVLLDLGLPDSKGQETFKKVTESVPVLPVVILTVSDNDAMAVQAINEGVQDYFVKGTVDERLLAQAIRYAIERKHVEQALRESEGRLRALTTATSDVIYRMSPDWSEMLGLTSRGFIADTKSPNRNWLQEYIHPDDQASVMAVVNEAIRTKGVFELEHRIVRIDGTLGWTFSRAVPVLDAGGEIVEWFGAASNITDRKRAEEALRESEEKFRVVAENARAIFGIIQGNHFVYANPYLAEITGYSAAELLEIDISQVVHPAFRPMVLDRARRRLLGEDLPSHYEFILLTRTGGERWLDFSVGRIMLQGRPALIGAAFDITDRKRTEEALKTTAADLARSNEDLAQFANIVSHDLQEPLRMVGSFLRLIQDESAPRLDDKAREYIGFAVDGADRMSQLLRDLLAYSRVGRGDEGFAQTDMQAVLSSTLANLHASIKESEAAITHDQLPTVKAQSSLMVQLLQNLIGNAIKFRATAPPHIHVGARREQRDWLLWVRDNGIGIKPEDRGRIFMIFQRLHTPDRYPGTGIGLAICKRIVEHHCGRIWVESEPGKGSTFFFTIPDRD